jgi:hypothetical protein
MSYRDRLRELGACLSAEELTALPESPREAWEQCERGDHLLWVAARVGVDRRVVVLASCACARQAQPHVPTGEDRPQQAIETCCLGCSC